jgi:hypothetical protein
MRLIREADRVERAEQEVARLVAREDPTGSVTAVRRRSEPYDEESGPRVAEGG